MMRIVLLASLLLSACRHAPPSPPPGSTPILSIAGSDSTIDVWPNGTVEYRSGDSLIRRAMSERHMVRLEELLRRGPLMMAGYRSYVAPDVTETLVTVRLPDRSYEAVDYPPACRVPDYAPRFDPPGATTKPVPTFVDELLRHLPVKRCAP